MKKITTIFIIAFAAINSFNAHAQTWSGSTPGDIYYNLGNVGIGTTSPAAKLDVVGSTNGGIFSVTTTGQEPDIRLRQTNTVNFNTRNWSMYTNSQQYGSLEFGVSSARFLDDYSTKMLIDLNGNVGIGTTNPSYKLDVNGNIHSSSAFYGSAMFLAGGNIQAANTNASYISGNTVLGNDGSANLRGTLTVSMAGYNGKVGIGTTTPDELLAVNGNVHAKEVRVDLTGWEDRVFKRTYKLPALSTVKTYIDLNHHLPDMPSEKELIRTGLNLGNMQKVLTKKVEELTLYIIYKDKQVAKFQNFNQTQLLKIELLQKQMLTLQKHLNKLEARVAGKR